MDWNGYTGSMKSYIKLFLAKNMVFVENFETVLFSKTV